ncbi:hypothetical protein CDAR_406471 [Caerostris darwini]|uniref:Uncharacterized protein n=1 Tax=Caerostris darwini TaxID=1538125 RepID=A0AAV4MPN5_9ARAC|nr:hypothetical protein CDAR_406471 [Caerostris darwini]
MLSFRTFDSARLEKKKGEMEPIAASSRLIRNLIRILAAIFVHLCVKASRINNRDDTGNQKRRSDRCSPSVRSTQLAWKKRKGEMEPIAASSRLIRNSFRFVTQIADCFSCETHQPPRSPREGGKGVLGWAKKGKKISDG